MSLIYLLSSLPMLSFDAVPGITPAQFVETCREQLSAPDAATAEALLYGQPVNHASLATWQNKEVILRNAVARQRARIAGQDAARWTRPAHGCAVWIENEVEAAFQEADPLKRELELDKVRWMIADELQGFDPLTVEAVFAYAVRLAIVTRWAGLNAEQGQQTFSTLTEVPMTL